MPVPFFGCLLAFAEVSTFGESDCGMSMDPELSKECVDRRVVRILPVFPLLAADGNEESSATAAVGELATKEARSIRSSTRLGFLLE